MSEAPCLFGSFPILTTLLLLGISPAAILLLVLFSPVLVTFMLFTLGIAGLARSRRKLRHHRNRRRRKNKNDEISVAASSSSSLLLDCEKQNRINEYLEDQLHNLGATGSWEYVGDEQGYDDHHLQQGVFFEGDDDDDDDHRHQSTAGDERCVRSDASDDYSLRDS